MVARIREQSVAMSIPAAAAAIGTRLWPVIPGAVLHSMKRGSPAASSMKSTRAQPAQPITSKARSASRLMRSATARGRRAGQSYSVVSSSYFAA